LTEWLGKIAMATKFGEKRAKAYENGNHFSCGRDIDTDICSEISFALPQKNQLLHSYVRVSVGRYHGNHIL